MRKIHKPDVTQAPMQELRQDSGLNQDELAYRCGLHRTCVGHVERGTVKVTTTTTCIPSDLSWPDRSAVGAKSVEHEG